MFVLQFETDNAAFDASQAEASAILRNVADTVDLGRHAGRILDSNGNTVGHWSMDLDDDLDRLIR